MANVCVFRTIFTDEKRKIKRSVSLATLKMLMYIPESERQLKCLEHNIDNSTRKYIILQNVRSKKELYIIVQIHLERHLIITSFGRINGQRIVIASKIARMNMEVMLLTIRLLSQANL